MSDDNQDAYLRDTKRRCSLHRNREHRAFQPLRRHKPHRLNQSDRNLSATNCITRRISPAAVAYSTSGMPAKARINQAQQGIDRVP
jgi:hypothetical protein